LTSFASGHNSAYVQLWLCALLAVASACERPSGAAAPSGPPPVPVELTPVTTTKLRETSEYVSTLRSRRSVRVQPQVTGWITDIPVESGARVTPGTILMRIDSRQQLAAVRGQAASTAARLADLQYWRQQVRRLSLLYKGGGASKQELDQATSSLRSAEAAVLAQDQQVRSAQVELRYYRVTAPEPGDLGDIPVRVGDLVNPQTLLTTIDQNDVLEAYVNVPVDQAGRVHGGLSVEIVERPDRPPTASLVTFVAPRASSDQTVLVKSKVDNGAGQLRNGQLVRARLIWSEREGPAVPVLAVQTLNGQTFVWTVKQAQGRLIADQRAVELGPLVNQSYPVLRGLAAGDRVVTAGMQKLRPGAPVVIASAASKDGGSEKKDR
jgi:RND family efflux transporter MFP subunit